MQMTLKCSMTELNLLGISKYQVPVLTTQTSTLVIPLMVIIAMVLRIVNPTDVHNNITFGQFTGVTCSMQTAVS